MKQKYVDLTKKNEPKNKKIINDLSINQQTVTNKIITKYIYINNHNSKTHLIMPYGSKENFKKVVNKYSNIIEI